MKYETKISSLDSDFTIFKQINKKKLKFNWTHLFWIIIEFFFVFLLWNKIIFHWIKYKWGKFPFKISFRKTLSKTEIVDFKYSIYYISKYYLWKNKFNTN